jgi:hypothetical protein
LYINPPAPPPPPPFEPTPPPPPPATTNNSILVTPAGHVQDVLVVVAEPLNTVAPEVVQRMIVLLIVDLLAVVPTGNVKFPVSLIVKLCSVAIFLNTF